METSVYDIAELSESYNRILISEAKKHLSMKDNRTFLRWAKKMCITIFTDGRKQTVLQGEFIPVLIAQSNRAMQEKYGENWQEGLQQFLSTPQGTVKPEPIIPFKKYKAKTKETASFASKWSHI